LEPERKQPLLKSIGQPANIPLLVVGPTGDTPLDPIAGGCSLLGRAVMSTRPSFLFAGLILHGIAARACETLHSSAALRF